MVSEEQILKILKWRKEGPLQCIKKIRDALGLSLSESKKIMDKVLGEEKEEKETLRVSTFRILREEGFIRAIRHVRDSSGLGLKYCRCYVLSLMEEEKELHNKAILKEWLKEGPNVAIQKVQEITGWSVEESKKFLDKAMGLPITKEERRKFKETTLKHLEKGIVHAVKYVYDNTELDLRLSKIYVYTLMEAK